MPRTKKAVTQRRCNKLPVVEYRDYYNLVFRAYADDDKVSRKDDTHLKEFETVCKSDDLFGVFRANIVMVDVDDGNNANIIQRILDDCGISYLYQKTTRGLHFFFYHGKWSRVLRDRSHIMSAVGLEVDYKCYSVDGTKLSKTLDDGTVQPRPLLTSPNWSGDLVDLPHFLVPVHAEKEFKELDCRNESFYIYILTLLRYGLDKEQTRHTIRLINNYVLSNKLSDREIETILREDAFPTNNDIYIYKHGEDKTAKLDLELFSNMLAEKYNISPYNYSMYIHIDGLYLPYTKDTLNHIVMSQLKNTKAQMRSEVNDYVRDKVLMCGKEELKPTKDCILFKNGVLNVKTREFRAMLPDDVFFNEVETEYHEKAEPQPIVNKFLNDISCGDEEIKALLLEMIGYGLLRGNEYEVFFWLTGDGGNGKGTLSTLIDMILGRNNTTHLTMKGINDRFGVGTLRNSMINISGDESTKYVEESETLKNLTGHDTIKVESKGKDHEEMIFNGIMIFFSNGIPKFKDTSAGLNRRIIVIPMLKNFEQDGKDIHFKSKLMTKDCLEYALKLAVDALYRVLERGFTKSKLAEDRKKEFILDNNPILQFLSEYEIDQNKDVKEIYLAYRVWCEENGISGIMSSNVFSRNLAKQGYERKQKLNANRKKYYVFVKSNQLKLVN